MKPGAKESFPPSAAGHTQSPISTLPVWDDALIAQEDWGAVLTATPVGSAGAAVAAGAGGPAATAGRDGKSGKGATATACGTSGFVDASGRAILERLVDWATGNQVRTKAVTEDAPDASKRNPADGTDAVTVAAADSSAAATAAAPPVRTVRWQRPAEIVKPFRPVVHRNATPFLDPYATGGVAESGPQPFDARLEEARYRVDPFATSGGSTGSQRPSAVTGGGANASGGSRSSGGRSNPLQGGHSKDAAGYAGSGPWHQLYPETVSLMEDLVGQDTAAWAGLSRAAAVARYRELPALMTPYAAGLVAGCAETPAEACRSRYSTALRHKLQQAEALAALGERPPFLMAGLNSALLAVERVQYLVPAGAYLWELVYPHAPGTCHPVYNPHGKYAVKLYVDGAYRKVVVDDAMPVDALGRPLITVTSRRELWPAILAKAIFKALGTAARQCLTTDPDMIVSCLMGNWVPQYLNPRRAPVATAALLVRYEAQLRERRTMLTRADTEPSCGRDEQLLPEAAAPPAPAAGSAASSRPGSRVSSANIRGRTTSTQRRSKSKDAMGDKPAQPRLQQVLKRLAAFEWGPLRDEEPPERHPLIVSGLRTNAAVSEAASTVTTGYPPDGAPAAAEPFAQLYAITDVVSFRNTLAVRVRTTPRSSLAAGIFEHERDAADVQDVLACGAALGSEVAAVSSEKLQAEEAVWLTFEELAESLDRVIVWRSFEGRYLHSVTVDATNSAKVKSANGSAACATVMAAAPTAAPMSAVSAVETSALSAAAGGAALPSRAVTWIHVRAEAPEEVAMVIVSPPAARRDCNSGAQAPLPPPPPVENSTAGGAQGGAKGAARRGKGSAAAAAVKRPAAVAHADAKDPKGASSTRREDSKGAMNESRPLTTAADGAPAAMAASPKTFATPSNGGARTEELSEHSAAEALPKRRYAQFELYRWDRAEPLSHAFRVPYESGKTAVHLLRLRPGSHVYKVTLPEMLTEDRVSFHSDARMTLRGDIVDLLRAPEDPSEPVLFHVISDAGVHPPVERADEETVWLKRRFNVVAETKLTMVLSALPPFEDLSAYRYAAPASQSGGGGASAAATVGGGDAKGSGKTSTALKAGGGGSGVGAASGGAGQGKSLAQRELAELDLRTCAVPILKHTKLVLFDLDRMAAVDADSKLESTGARAADAATGSAPPRSMVAEFADRVEAPPTRQSISNTALSTVAPTMASSAVRIGIAGKLPMVTLRPNRRGYLLMAYTCLTPTEAEVVRSSFLQAAGGPGAPTTTVANAAVTSTSGYWNSREDEEATNSAAATVPTQPPPALYGKGLWTLALRSDRELPAFDAVIPDQQVVRLSGTLRRGGAGQRVLLRYAVTVQEPTHFSLLLTLSGGVQLPFDLRLCRRLVPERAARTGGNPTSQDGDTLVASAAATAESEDALAEGRRSSAATNAEEHVICSAGGCRNHAFVPELLLDHPRAAAPAVSGRADKSSGSIAAGGSGGTVYILEASVPAAAAEAWEARCRLVQAERFRETRDEAVMRIATAAAAEAAEFAQDRNAFIARCTETLEQTSGGDGLLTGSVTLSGANGSIGTHVLTRTSRDAGAGSDATGAGNCAGTSNVSLAARRRRSLDKKKGSIASSSTGLAAAAGGRSSRNARTSASGDASAGGEAAVPSTAAAAVAAAPAAAAAASGGTYEWMASVDSTPDELAVTFHGKVLLSSSRAEVLSAIASEDPVSQLRALWKDFGILTLEGGAAAIAGTGSDAGLGGGGASSGASGARAGGAPVSAGGGKVAKTLLAQQQQQQQQRRELRDAEEQLRGERGRRSREAFLANPMNVLRPHLAPPRAVDSTGGGGALGREGLTSSRGRSPNTVGSSAIATGGALSRESNASSRASSSKNVSATEGTSSITAAGGGGGAGAGAGARILVLEDTEESLFVHRTPLSPAAYSVKLLPLRAVELGSAAAPGADGSLAPLSPKLPASGNKRGAAGPRATTQSSAGNVGAAAATPGSSAITTQAAGGRERDRSLSTSAAAEAPALSLAGFAEAVAARETQRARERFLAAVREPLAEHSMSAAQAAQVERMRMRSDRAACTALMAAFWEARAGEKKSGLCGPSVTAAAERTAEA